MAGLVPAIHGREAALSAPRTCLDCMVVALNMEDAGGHSDRGWVLSTVGISDGEQQPGNPVYVVAAAARPAGGIARPALVNRPRRSHTPCSPCFIRSRSGIANSTMTILHPLRVPMPV